MLAVMSASPSPSPSPRTPNRARPRPRQQAQPAAADDLWDMPTTGTPASASASSARKSKKGSVPKRSSNLALAKQQFDDSHDSSLCSPLSWQQQALVSSSPAPPTPTPSKKTSGKKNNKHQPNAVSSSAPSSTIDLTWQQALFPGPSLSPSQASSAQQATSASNKKSKKKAAAVAAAEKSYAGPLFHQSPSAQSLPAPKFKPAASSGLRHESPETVPATASIPGLTSDTSSNSSGELAPASSPITIPAQSNSALLQSSPLDSPTPAAPRPKPSPGAESQSAPAPVPMAAGSSPYAHLVHHQSPAPSIPSAPHTPFLPQAHPGSFHIPHPHLHWPHLHHQSIAPPAPAVSPGPKSHSRTLSLATLFPNHSFEHPRAPTQMPAPSNQTQAPVQSAPIPPSSTATTTAKPVPAAAAMGTDGDGPQTIETLLAKLMV